MAPNFTPTTDAYAIPTVIANEMIRLLPSYMNLAKFVSRDTDWTGKDFATYGQVLQITKPGALTVKKKAANTEMVSQAPNLDKVTVTLDQHDYIDILDEDFTKLLRKPDTQQQYAMNMAIKIAEGIEGYMLGLHASIPSTVTWDRSSESAMDQSFRRIRSFFARHKVPVTMPKGFFADTSIVDDLLSVTKYTSGDFQNSKDTIATGIIKRQYGIDTFESQLVPSTGSPGAYHNVATTPYGMVLVNRPMPLDGNGKGVMQRNMQDPNTGLTFRVTEGYSHGNLGSRFTIDVVYGGAICDTEQIVEVESF